jgi:predicted permease
VVRVWPEKWLTKEEFTALRPQAKAYRSLAAYTAYGGVSVTGDGPPEALSAAMVSAEFFDVLGVRPLLGRGFREGEDQPGAERVAILGDGLWRRRFGGDSGVVGSRVLLGGEPTLVVGVMPASVRFPSPRNDLWLPMPFDPSDAVNYRSNYLQLVGRLAPGWTVAQAQAEGRALAQSLAARFGLPEDYGQQSQVIPLRMALVGDVRPAMLSLLGAVACVLLIAAVNVANLLLARGAGRTREFAIRSALGADRRRIARLVLVESLVLAFLGGVVAVATAVWGLQAIRPLLPAELPRLHEVSFSGRLLAFSSGLTLAVGFVFGLIPALRAGAGDVQGRLRESGGAIAGFRASGLRSGLVVSQVALAVVLALGAGLLARSFWRLTHVDPGLDPQRLLCFWPVLPASYDDYGLARRTHREIIARIRAAPGVADAGGISMIPVSNRGYVGGFLREEQPDEVEPPVANWRVVTPGYFSTARVPLLQGRLLTESDREDTPEVALVNRTLAERFWPGEDPLGRRFRIALEQTDWITIVGVVGDVRQHGLENDVRPEVYRPLRQNRRQVGTAMLVRTAADPEAVAAAVREAVWSVDPNIPLARLRTMEDVIQESVAQPRLVSGLIGALAGLALLLGAVGTYGVLSGDVAHRTREIGVRMALGAARRDVLLLVLRGGMGLVLTGVAVGIPVAFAVSRALRGLLFQVPPSDPVTYLAVVSLLVVVGGLATYLPARRAAGIEPLEAIRHE